MKPFFSFCLILLICHACTQEAGRVLPSPEKGKTMNLPVSNLQAGNSLAEAPALIRKGNWTKPVSPNAIPNCRHKGTIIRTAVTHCSLIIRLDNGLQLQPASLPYPYHQLKAGQRVSVDYNIHQNQNHNCDAGQLADITCLQINEKDPESFNESKGAPSTK